MSKLLILPGNKAIRQNPDDPNGFPDATHQVLVPGVKEALNFYKQQGFTIAVCENAGGVAQGIHTLSEKLSEMIILMTQIAPQIDQLIFCTDFNGIFAYELTKYQPNSFPFLQRLRCKRVSGYQRHSAPGDDAESWEDVDEQPFRKPEPGLLDWVIRNTKPRHTIAVWERDEDKQAAESTTFNQGNLYIQSAKLWREALDPIASDTQVQPKPQVSNNVPQPRTFHFVHAGQNSYKFWTIRRVDALTFDITYGRIGSNGRTIRKTFQTTAEASADYQKRISEQLNQGYVEQ